MLLHVIFEVWYDDGGSGEEDNAEEELGAANEKEAGSMDDVK